MAAAHPPYLYMLHWQQCFGFEKLFVSQHDGRVMTDRKK